MKLKTRFLVIFINPIKLKHLIRQILSAALKRHFFYIYNIFTFVVRVIITNPTITHLQQLISLPHNRIYKHTYE